MRTGLLAASCLALLLPLTAHAQRGEQSPRPGPAAAFSQVLGRPTDHAATLSILSESAAADVFVEYGTSPGRYTSKSPTLSLSPGQPREFELAGLPANASCFYRVQTRGKDAKSFTPSSESSFHTARAANASFTFAVQGDSHPERPGKMYDPDLYIRTMQNVAADAPDFYFLMGDDFSIERLIERKSLSQSAVDRIYAHQRGFLGLVGKSAPLMLVNGNHEQAAKYLLDGTATNAAVFAGKARTTFYPLPAPDSFYSGNAEPVEHIGLLRDYYAWTWSDALFVVIDPYWHSDVPVDNEAGTRAPQADAGRQPQQPGESNRDAKRRARETGNGNGGGGKGNRDLWQITLGDAQYRWLTKTLRESHAPFKFVFSHHVLGTGRGGIEQADKFEWGGDDRRGFDRFFQMRPTWAQPIHDLMRDAGVTIFFQGHDHLYARQQLDGVTYQTVPNPADSTFTTFNRDSYKSGDIFPNSGHLRITVSHDQAKVEYIRSFRPQDEGEGKTNASIAHAYTLTPRPMITPAKPSAQPRPSEKP